jgi:two-component system, OmpR family, sensor kinase
MREYLYKTKIQVLQERFHNLDMESLSKENMTDITEDVSKEILKNLWDKSMSVAIIDKEGNIIGQRSNAETPKDDKDGDDDSKELAERKIEEIPVPVSSKESYISRCNEEGNLERAFQVVEDKNGNYQLVAWRKIGDLDSPIALIQISTSINDIEAILSREVYMHTSISILILIIGTIVATTIIKRTLIPLDDITNTVEGINVTDLHTRLDTEKGQSEINRLAKSFNIMLERIEISFEKEQTIKEKMRRFVSDASHELRTPLTSIHGFVEVLLRESERLTKLVNDLLVLTRLEQNPVVEISRESINDIIEEIHPQLQILTKDRELKLDLKEGIMAYINRNQIKQVIFNLAQNAVLHTDKSNGVIKISTTIEKLDDENYAVLKIADNGIGISKENITKIYDRFFRVESHRSRQHGGYGLGLSIVNSIIDSNNGKIHVESEVNVGTTFSVYLKLSQ